MFFAYKSSPNGTEFRFDARDESQESLGSFAPGDSLPVSQAETIEDLEAQAYALLGKEPAWLLYLTDDQLRVHRILIKRKHHAILEKSQERARKGLVLWFSGSLLPEFDGFFYHAERPVDLRGLFDLCDDPRCIIYRCEPLAYL